MNKTKPKVLIIAGPTASGKSALAVDVARFTGGVIINCDALQIYKNIPVISAAPSFKEKSLAEHRLYEIYECTKRGNVVEWLNLCVKEIKDVWQTNKLPIVVGGTGMYIDALINGVTPITEVSSKVRNEVQNILAENGLDFLYDFLQKNDEEIALKLNKNDKTRIVRAVEIIKQTGRKVSDWYKEPLIKKLPGAQFKIIKILPDIENIEGRCRDRLDKMVYEDNAIDEIKYLLRLGLDETMPAMKALGIPELLQYVKGNCSLTNALDLAKLHTRQYVKRQRTWLKNKLSADITLSDVYKKQEDVIKQILMWLNA